MTDLLEATAREMVSMPPIATLDEYIHMRHQLEAMRARSGELFEQKLAMELAVLFILDDYDERIGMPPFVMPGPDGKGGVLPYDVVPSEWRSA